MKAIQNRYSCRDFDKNYVISDDEVTTLVNSIRLSPSAGNTQDVVVYVIKNSEIKKDIGKIYWKEHDIPEEKNFFVNSSVIFVLFAAPKISEKRYKTRSLRYSILDTGIACENLCLAATDLKLGSVIVGAFDDDQLSKILKVSDQLKPMAIVPVGKPKTNEIPKKHREPIESRFVILL